MGGQQEAHPLYLIPLYLIAHYLIAHYLIAHYLIALYFIRFTSPDYLICPVNTLRNLTSFGATTKAK
jgi:hypothetical protein